MFPCLRRLTLRHFWTEPGELNAVLPRHRATLEELVLSSTNLGGLADTMVPFPKLSYFFYLPPPRQRTFDKKKGGSAGNMAWVQVAAACQMLPELKGLRLEAPSVSIDRCVLGMFEAEEIVELGMNERENSLGQGFWGDVWKSLEG